MFTDDEDCGAAQTPAFATPSQRPATKEVRAPVLDEAALHGPLGDFVRLVEPHTESDPAAILAQGLSAFSAYSARTAYFEVERDKHYTNMFCLVVGDTSKARKGTSLGWVRRLFDGLPNLQTFRSGLASGEGLKFAVRDGDDNDGGVQDKRLTIVETEFAQVLRVASRPGNTVSTTIREVWDRGTFGTLTRKDPLQVTDAHISVIGHITREELLRELDSTDAANGFGNRFQFIHARRTKLLPFGGEGVDDAKLAEIRGRIQRAAEIAAKLSRVTMTETARLGWVAAYKRMAVARPGLVGSLTARAEAHVLRLALNYALLDQSATIDVSHLEAAIAFWEYCEQSVEFIFAGVSSVRFAERVKQRLRERGPSGISRTELNRSFSGHVSARELTAALDDLHSRGEAMQTFESTAGCRVERWIAIAQ